MLLYGIDENENPRLLKLDSNGRIKITFSDGGSTQRFTSVSNSPLVVKSSAGKIIGFNIINPNMDPVYLKFYDTASPTIGTTAPKNTLSVPSNGTVLFVSPRYWSEFTTAISMACVSGLEDSSTDPPDQDIYCEITYI